MSFLIEPVHCPLHTSRATFLRYLYDGGNYLSVASYGSLLAAFTAALTEKLEIDEYSGYQVTIHFKNVR